MNQNIKPPGAYFNGRVVQQPPPLPGVGDVIVPTKYSYVHSRWLFGWMLIRL